MMFAIDDQSNFLLAADYIVILYWPLIVISTLTAILNARAS